jgi:hypothetical protein
VHFTCTCRVARHFLPDAAHDKIRSIPRHPFTAAAPHPAAAVNMPSARSRTTLLLLPACVLAAAVAGCDSLDPLPEDSPVWSAAVQLPGAAADLRPAQLIAAGGQVYLLTARHGGAGTGFDAATDLLLHARTDGTWAAPEVAGAGAPEMRWGRFARDGSGGLHFIWMASRGMTTSPTDPDWEASIRYRSRTGAAWSATETIHANWGADGGSITAIPLAAASDAQGRVHMVFAEGAASSFAWTRVQDGAAWRTERIRIAGPGWYPSYSVGGTGEASLAFFGSDYPDGTPESFRRGIWTMLYRNGAWEARVPVAHQPTGSVSHPRIAVESGGRRHLVWTHREGSTSALLHATSTSGTDWSAPVQVPGGATWEPQLVIDGHGRLHLFTGILEQPGTVRYRRFRNGVWTDVASLPATAMRYPQLAFDGDSLLHAVWRGDDDRLYHATLDVGSGGW